MPFLFSHSPTPVGPPVVLCSSVASISVNQLGSSCVCISLKWGCKASSSARGKRESVHSVHLQPRCVKPHQGDFNGPPCCSAMTAGRSAGKIFQWKCGKVKVCKEWSYLAVYLMEGTVVPHRGPVVLRAHRLTQVHKNVIELLLEICIFRCCKVWENGATDGN